jgi:hypothetical protein
MHFENLLFILLIAIAVLLRLLATKAGEGKKRPQKSDQRSRTTPQMSEPIRRAPVGSDEERIRRFLEALGQPATSKPPPPIVPRADLPPRPLAPVQPPPIPTARNILTRRKRQIAEPPRFPAPAPISERPEAVPPRELPASIKPGVEAYAIDTESKTKAASTGTDIATLLRSTAGLRNAIILREIFGPPRSLQPLDLVGSA